MLICCVVILGPAVVITGIVLWRIVCALVADARVETMVAAVVGAIDRSCQEVYERGSMAVVPEEVAEVFANLGSGASASNSRSRDLVTVGEAGMVVATELVTNNGLLVVIA
ncbi:hypothetical protein HanXRQr2_Chr16g0763561 [Helianthus annuus]|uniref:Uncharacterized protein n=1 Tax=Helianthus annuus TaxID=4232 RepID=A0A9K3GZV9_HELAN|nr:hypothetical protein HanXRQr2_Chr16g0763561 [Helianthus annuus]KAJ0444214.1 hypothetical protein HanIR_Chr16g0829331 [Helianthus annuus]KAJ0822411.1 hypothetical protein HanPSC8_Chr16g0731701 [Helianthus annuus]